MSRAGASRAGEAARAWGAAAAQVLFASSPLTGLGLLGGAALLAPAAALGGALGGIGATLAAAALGYPRAAWSRGLYGYTGVLVGLYWGALFEPTAAAWAALGLAAAAAAPLTRLAFRLLTPHEIPALALPALALVWLMAPLLPRAPGTAPAPEAALLGWAVILVALAASSRLLALAGLLGAGVGSLTSLLLAGSVEGGVVSNAVPAAVALGAVFLPCTPASLLVGGGGAALAGALWWSAAPAGDGLPPLLAPFTLVTLVALAALRRHGWRRWLPGCPAPLPLEAITSPERSREAWRARRRLLALLLRARRVSVLTGAGVSTEAGLPDVRSAFGLWSRERGITLEEFLRSPAARAECWAQEERFFRLLQRARPAPAHEALAALHRAGRLTAVVTQNVDGLHQAAGLPADAVIELHGSAREARCLDCGHGVPRERLAARLARRPAALYCERCQGLLRGGGLLFGEPVAAERLEAALRALLASDLLLVLGTSLAVAPASDLVGWAHEAGIPVGIVNATPTSGDALAAVALTAEVGAFLVDAAHALGAPPPPALAEGRV